MSQVVAAHPQQTGLVNQADELMPHPVGVGTRWSVTQLDPASLEPAAHRGGGAP